VSDYENNIVLIIARFVECCNVALGSIKYEDFLYQLSNCCFFQKGFHYMELNGCYIYKEGTKVKIYL
jgi:hypothetical protein